MLHKQQLLLVVVLSLVAIPAFAASAGGGAVSLVQQTEIGYGVSDWHLPAPSHGNLRLSASPPETQMSLLIEYCGLPGRRRRLELTCLRRFRRDRPDHRCD